MKCKKGFRRKNGRCTKSKILINMKTRKKLNPVFALIIGVIIGGFGWMSIRGFADLWAFLNPFQFLIVGILGILLVGGIANKLGIKVNNPLRK